MDLWQSIQVILRRWYIVVPLVALTAFAAVGMSRGIAPEYVARGSVILTGGGESNPYRGSLGTTAIALQYAAVSSSTTQDLAERNLPTQYQIEVERRAPIIVMTVRGDDPVRAVEGLRRLIVLVQAKMAELETRVSVPEGQGVAVGELEVSDVASMNTEARSRTRVMVFAVGSVVSVAIAFVVDALSGARRRRSTRLLGAAPSVGDDGVVQPAPIAASGGTQRFLPH